MVKYNTVVSTDWDAEFDVFICELSADDVAKAEKEFSCYMQSKGRTYDMDENKRPTIKNFFKLYFGEYDGICWYAPDRYICTNKNVANRFMKLAKQLDYHDRFNQTYCNVEQNGKIIDVFYGDY